MDNGCTQQRKPTMQDLTQLRFLEAVLHESVTSLLCVMPLCHERPRTQACVRMSCLAPMHAARSCSQLVGARMFRAAVSLAQRK